MENDKFRGTLNTYMKNNKVALIGIGNMGSAIVEGALLGNVLTPSNVTVYDKDVSKAKAFSSKNHVKKAISIKDLLSEANIILVAVKPQNFCEVAEELKSLITKKHVFISILAGTSIQKIKKNLGRKVAVVRAMPNLGAKIRQSMTAISGSDKKAVNIAKKLFSGCGEVIQVKEKMFDVITAVSGSGPAYFFFLMEALASFAVKNGISKKTAELLAAQTCVGSGLLVSNEKISPRILRKKVTSKGGTTEKALDVLKSNKTNKIFELAFRAAARTRASSSRRSRADALGVGAERTHH